MQKEKYRVHKGLHQNQRVDNPIRLPALLAELCTASKTPVPPKQPDQSGAGRDEEIQSPQSDDIDRALALGREGVQEHATPASQPKKSRRAPSQLSEEQVDEIEMDS